MPKLNDYHAFAGRHWETGTVHNYYAYCGVKAPHTNEPYSEALLMGISGGAVMGYFSFAYEGYDPYVAILTRNTFDPLNTLLVRLGVVQDILQTDKAAKAVKNLTETLEDGLPAIVWADLYCLPYNGLGYDQSMWAMFPIVVYGYETDQDRVSIADRANIPLTVTPAELATARARVKKDKHRILTLDLPNPDKLISAVQMGIWDCIKLYTEAPPKGSKHNFGLAAYQRWAKLLTKPKQKQSWAREFPAGRKLYAGLSSTFDRIAIFGSDGIADAERTMYANFLDEATILLNRPKLQQAADLFRESAQAWINLGHVLLPDEVPLLKQSRTLMTTKHRLFLNQGPDALAEIQQINEQLDELKGQATAEFPLNEVAVTDLLSSLQSQVLTIHDIEQEAIKALKKAMV